MVMPLARDVLRAARKLFPGTTAIEVGIRFARPGSPDAGVGVADCRQWHEDEDLAELAPLGKALREYDTADGNVWDLYCYGRREDGVLIGNLDLVFQEGTFTVRDPFRTGDYVPSPGTEHL